MIEKQRVPGSSPAWKRNLGFFPAVLRPTALGAALCALIFEGGGVPADADLQPSLTRPANLQSSSSFSSSAIIALVFRLLFSLATLSNFIIVASGHYDSNCYFFLLLDHGAPVHGCDAGACGAPVRGGP